MKFFLDKLIGVRKRAESKILSRVSRAATKIIILLFLSVFAIDIITPALNVSICYAYCIPIVLSIMEEKRRSFVYAGAATILSIIGSFIQPPYSEVGVFSFIFTVSRATAIATQWLVAAVVSYQARLFYEEQQKFEQQRRFTDILSHEIGSALTAISGHTYRLAKLSDNMERDDVIRRASIIQASVARIKTVIDRIQFVAFLNSGSYLVEPQSLDLKSLLEKVVGQFEDEHRSRLCLEFSKLHCRVKGDEALLFHAFENLIQNSLRYSKPGTLVRIRSVLHGGNVQVIVTDQGSGIDPDDLPHLSAPYFRGRNSRGIRGTGLGLYIADQIAKAHCGSLTIQSKVGEGTTVTMDIPVVAEAGGHP